MDWPSCRVLTSVIMAVLGSSFRFGFNMNIVNPLGATFNQLMITSLQDHYLFNVTAADSNILAPVLAGLNGGVMSLGAAIGASTFDFIGAKVGRRVMIMVCQVMFMVFSIMAAASYYNMYELFLCSQFGTGVFLAYGFATTTNFIMEISDPRHASLLQSIVALGLEVGNSLANFMGIDVVFGSKNLWPFIFLSGGLVNLGVFVGFMFFAKETPVYHVRKGDNVRALQSIKFYFDTCDTNAQEKLKTVIAADSKVSQLHIYEALWNPRTRKPMLLTAAVAACSAMSGVLSMSLFGTTILANANLSPAVAGFCNFGFNASFLVGVTISMFLQENHRKLLLCGLPVLAACNVTCGGFVQLGRVSGFKSKTSPQVSQSPAAAYGIGGAMLAFGLVFAMSLETVGFANGALITPLEALDATASLAVLVTNLLCFAVPLLFYPLMQSGGGLAFLPSFVSNLSALLLFYLYYPGKHTVAGEQGRSKMHLNLS